MVKTTIKDIANYVGVSVSTVSNVINGKHHKVSEEMKGRIYQAIDDLNYRPNYSARSLVNKKSKLIGVIIPQTEDYKQLLLQNPFYSEIVSGIESEIREQGYYMMLSGVDKNKNYLDIFVNWNLDGAIIMGVYQEEVYNELKKLKIPIAVIDSYIYDDYFYNIGIDDEKGGYLATKHLLDNGHKKIALVTGHIRKDGVSEKRFLGYKKALKEAKIFYNPDYVFEKSVSYEYGCKIGNVIGKDYENITGIVATADVIAAGIIKGINQVGKQVPRDISVIGFDDVSIAKMLIPSLTTVKQNITLKGQKAASLIIDIIEKPPVHHEKEILMLVEIIKRDSVRHI